MSALFEELAAALRDERPAALSEVIEGPDELLGGKLLLLPGAPLEVLGSRRPFRRSSSYRSNA